jgi:hypothetical protein
VIAEIGDRVVGSGVSSHRMQRLLSRLGFVARGFIDELDPGDPEPAYVKKLAGDA